MPEFTGERVIPGLVDIDLFNEHVARYRFAARWARGRSVLDAGCGSGYGTAEFGDAAFVIGMDVSFEAVGIARESFARPHVRFLAGACENLPFAAASFDLMTAFEVIEHLEHWRELLDEAKRVLKPAGVFLVSTPNKAWYTESRAEAGPNPFHRHEFEYAEFENALREVFPHVRLWTQNHAESIVFAPLNPAEATLEAAGDPTPEHAGFFLAACGSLPIESREVYAWVPSSSNILREREHHIAKLEGELRKKDEWLEEFSRNHAGLQRAHDLTLAELEARNEWATRLNGQLDERIARVIELQQEAEDRLSWIGALEAEITAARANSERLEAELAARTAWALSLDEQLETRSEQMRLHDQRLNEYAERIEGMTGELQRLKAERRLIAESKWIRLGRRLNVGPAVRSIDEPE